MSAVLEQYFQTVVVDKINEKILKKFQEIKNDFEGCYNKADSDSGLRKLESNYNNLLNEIEGLKKQISGLERGISKTIQKDIKQTLEKIGKEAEATKKAAPTKKTPTKKTSIRKTTAKKTVKK